MAVVTHAVPARDEAARVATALKTVASAKAEAIACLFSVTADRHVTEILAIHVGLPEAIAPARVVAIVASGRASTIARHVARPTGA